MGAAFKGAVKHTEKNFAILKEEIGHHLQDLRAQEPTYRRDSDEKSQPLPPVTKMRPEARGNPGQVRPETASMQPNWSTHGARTSAIHPCSGGEGLFYNKKSCEGGLAKNVEKDDEKT